MPVGTDSDLLGYMDEGVPWSAIVYLELEYPVLVRECEFQFVLGGCGFQRHPVVGIKHDEFHNYILLLVGYPSSIHPFHNLCGEVDSVTHLIHTRVADVRINQMVFYTPNL